MPVYKVEGPDGKVYTIEGPEGATAEQLGAFIQSQKAPNPAQSVVDQMSGPERFAAGAGKAVADTGLGLRQVGAWVGDKVSPVQQPMSSLVTGQKTPTRVEQMREEVQDARTRDKPLMDTPSGLAGNVAGNLGMFLIPGGGTIAAGRALTKIPAAARLAEALMAGGKSLVAPATIPGAAAVGATQGALQPSVSGSETLMNAGIGGAAGAAAPVISRGVQVGRALLDPFSKSGQERIVGRAINDAAGGEAATAMANLRGATEIVPGSVPTAGQAAGNAGVAALERTATASDPVAMVQMANRMKAQNDARVATLQGVAPDRAAAVSAREAATSSLYRQAYGEQIAVTPELQALLSRPSMQSAQGRASQLAKEQGQGLTMRAASPPQPSPILNAAGTPMSVTPGASATMTGRDAHLMKMGLDDMENASPMTGIGRNELRAIQGTKSEFLDEVAKQVPVYDQARKTYAQMSRPINQADVVDEISKSINPLRENITPMAYARALNDKAAEKATGRAGATLSDVMEPDQLKALNAIKEDLRRADFAQTAGRGVGSDTVQKLAFSNLMRESGLPAWATAAPRAVGLGGIVQRAGQVAYKDANDEMRARLAQALLNPADTAALMEAGTVTPQVRMLIESLRRGGAGLGAATPALLNATKE